MIEVVLTILTTLLIMLATSMVVLWSYVRNIKNRRYNTRYVLTNGKGLLTLIMLDIPCIKSLSLSLYILLWEMILNCILLLDLS